MLLVLQAGGPSEIPAFNALHDIIHKFIKKSHNKKSIF